MKIKGRNISLKTIELPLLFMVIFYSVGFWRYFATGKIFYIYNFIYLGTSLAIGIFLSEALPKKMFFGVDGLHNSL